jgi:hypothetical protein
VKWLKKNGMTLGMSLLLSLVTVGLLSEPEKDRTHRTQNVTFSPDIRDEVRSDFGSIVFEVNGNKHTTNVPVTMSGNETDVLSAFQNLVCQPILDRSKFPFDDSSVRDIKLDITKKDFNLPADLAAKVDIRPFEMKVLFAPMWRIKLPLEVSRSDIEDTKDSRYRVEAVRAIPPSIWVRLPVDKLSVLTSLPIKPIRIEGRTKTFQVEGSLNMELPDLKDVRRLETFTVEVELSLIHSNTQLEGIQLSLSAPPIPGHKVELIDRLEVRVNVEGPEDLLRTLREKPELIHVYVKLDPKNWTIGSNPLGIRCEVPEEFRKNQVRVSLAPGEPAVAQVQVTRN